MQLSNKWATDLLNKNPKVSSKAAIHIINNKDMDAWACLAENSGFFFDFIKDKIAQNLINAFNEENFKNISCLMQRYDNWLADIIALSACKFNDPKINNYMFDLLKNGDIDQKSYAARYFAYVKYDQAENLLLEYISEENENLKTNSVEALSLLESSKTYNCLMEKLNSNDEWQQVEAAQLLCIYNNQEALKPILETMTKSNMKENLASEAALLSYLGEYFNNEDTTLALLTLEALDNILIGLSEILPLGNLIDYNMYECIQTLLKLSETEHELNSKYAQVLLRAKLKFETLVNNDQYIFDETKDIKEEIQHISNILTLKDKTFWDDITYSIGEELHQKDLSRKSAAIAIINEMKLKFTENKLINIVRNLTIPDIIVCEAVQALAAINSKKALKEIEKLTIRIKDPNIIAIINSAIQHIEAAPKEKD